MISYPSSWQVQRELLRHVRAKDDPQQGRKGTSLSYDSSHVHKSIQKRRAPFMLDGVLAYRMEVEYSFC